MNHPSSHPPPPTGVAYLRYQPTHGQLEQLEADRQDPAHTPVAEKAHLAPPAAAGGDGHRIAWYRVISVAVREGQDQSTHTRRDRTGRAREDNPVPTVIDTKRKARAHGGGITFTKRTDSSPCTTATTITIYIAALLL